MAAGATGHPPQRYIRGSDSCSCDVTRASSGRAAYSYCASRVLFVVRRNRGEDNGKRACKRANLLSRACVCVASVSCFYMTYILLNVFRRLCLLASVCVFQPPGRDVIRTFRFPLLGGAYKTWIT